MPQRQQPSSSPSRWGSRGAIVPCRGPDGSRPGILDPGVSSRAREHDPADSARPVTRGRRRRRAAWRAGGALARRPAPRWRRARRSSSGSRPRTSRSTASRPASARSPTTPIPPERREELQRALVRSHAAGHGRRRSSARSCARWCSCAPARSRWAAPARARVVAETMLALLDAGITPVVPEHGSLGAQRRPRAARALRARAARRGRGAGCRRRPSRPPPTRSRERRHRAARADARRRASR